MSKIIYYNISRNKPWRLYMTSWWKIFIFFFIHFSTCLMPDSYMLGLCCFVLCCVVLWSDVMSLQIKQTKRSLTSSGNSFGQLFLLEHMLPMIFSALTSITPSVSCGDVEESKEPSQLLFSRASVTKSAKYKSAHLDTRLERRVNWTRTATAADLQQYSNCNDVQHLLRLFASSVPPDRCQTGVQFTGESSDARAHSYMWHAHC